MAIISCPECGKEISNLADVCIHCGFPIRRYTEPVQQPAGGAFSGTVIEAKDTYREQDEVKSAPVTTQEVWKMIIVFAGYVFVPPIGLMLIWLWKLPEEKSKRIKLTVFRVVVWFLLHSGLWG